MNLVLSLFLRELFTQPRKRLFYLRRLVWLGIAGGVVCMFCMQTGCSRNPSTTGGLRLFLILTGFSVVSMFFIPLYTSATLVLRERTERTLGLLFMTDLKGWQIVTGKFLTALFYSMVYALGMLPLVILTASLGGVSNIQILATFLMLLGILFLGTCVGLFTGTVSASESRMSKVLFLTACILFGVIPEGLVRAYVLTFSPAYEDLLFNITSPIRALKDLTDGINMHHSIYNALYNTLIGLPFLLVTYSLLPRKAFGKKSHAQKINLFTRKPIAEKTSKTPRLRGNPVAWREYYFSYGGKVNSHTRNLLAILFLAVICVGVSFVFDMDATDFVIPVIVFSSICFGIFVLGTVAQASGAFYTDRTGRTLEVLLTTSLSERDIVVGKGVAICKAAAPWMIGALIGCFVWFFIIITRPEAWYIWIGLAAVLSIWFSFCCMAMWLSIKFKRAVALVISIIVFVVWSLFGQAILLPLMFIAVLGGAITGGLGGEEVGFVVGTAIAALIYIALHVGLGIIFSLLLTRTLRMAAMRNTSS